MSKKSELIILLLLLPALAEAINSDAFLITIPGFPLSLGRLLFVLCGLIGFKVFGRYSFKTGIFKGLLLVSLGCLVGSFFSDNTLENLSSTIGFILLLFGSCGVAMLFYLPRFRSLADVFFVILFIYWVVYSIDKTIISGNFTAYSILDKEGNVINHHIAGMGMMVSSAYLAVRFFYKSQMLSLNGFIVFGIALLGCLLVESRSNFLFTLITLVVLILTERFSFKRSILITIPIVIVGILTLSFFFNKMEFLKQRFSIQDFDYQVRTNKNRIAFLESAFDAILEKPLGRGIKNTKLTVFGGRVLVHNQYVSFIISGGIIALAGIVIWLKDLIKLFKFTYFRKRVPWEQGYNSFILGVSLGIFAFSITLFTIESSGMLFFLLVSLAIFSSYSLITSEQISELA